MKNDSADQKVVARITLKHEHEFNSMKEEMNNLIITITEMGNKLQTLMNELKTHPEAEREVQIVNEMNIYSNDK